MWRFVVGWIVSDVWKDRNVFICRIKDCLGTAHLTQVWHLQQDCYGNPKSPYHNSYCLLNYCTDIYFYKCVSINNFYLFTYLYCEERRYCRHTYCMYVIFINPLNPELNPICYLLALLGANHFLHVSRIRVKLLTFRLLMSYIYGAPILDVSRSHTTTQHSR